MKPLPNGLEWWNWYGSTFRPLLLDCQRQSPHIETQNEATDEASDHILVQCMLKFPHMEILGWFIDNFCTWIAWCKFQRLSAIFHIVHSLLWMRKHHKVLVARNIVHFSMGHWNSAQFYINWPTLHKIVNRSLNQMFLELWLDLKKICLVVMASHL